MNAAPTQSAPLHFPSVLGHLTDSMGGRTTALELDLAVARTELDAAKAEIVHLRQQLEAATAAAGAAEAGDDEPAEAPARGAKK